MTEKAVGRENQLEYDIRPAVESDLIEIAAIEKQCFSEPWSEESFRTALNQPDKAVISVAVERNKRETDENVVISDEDALVDSGIIGYFVMYYSFDEGELETTAVHPGYRGHGIGHALMREMKRQAIEREVDKIFLEVRMSNESAISLYISEGWIQVGTRPNFYRFPTEDAYLMRWERDSEGVQ